MQFQCTVCATLFELVPSKRSDFCSVLCKNRAIGARRRVVRPEQIWSRIAVMGDPDACWPWLGYADKDGYGRCTYKGEFIRVTQFIWEDSTSKTLPPTILGSDGETGKT